MSVNESDNTDKIINRILKCLALGDSPEPHEAAAALQQAQKLMEKYGISEEQLKISEVKEKAASAGRCAFTPPLWMTQLAEVITEAFGVAQFYQQQIYKNNEFVFVGVGPAAEVAGYSFTVLRRKCTSSREAYYRSLRGKRSSRIRRADAYALGWVMAVKSIVRNFARTVPQIVGEYLEQRHTGLISYKPINRSSERDMQHVVKGWLDGTQVDLHHGVAGMTPKQITDTPGSGASENSEGAPPLT